MDRHVSIVNEKCCLPYQQKRSLQLSNHLITAAPTVSPAGTQDGGTWSAHCQALSHCSTPSPNCICWGDSGWRKAGHWPQIAEVSHQRNDFKEPRLLYPPIHRNVLNSVTGDIWFSLISSHLLMFHPPGLCCKAPTYPGPLPGLLGAVRVIWDAGSWAWSLQNVHWIKNNSQLLGCAFFPVDTITLTSQY